MGIWRHKTQNSKLKIVHSKQCTGNSEPETPTSKQELKTQHWKHKTWNSKLKIQNWEYWTRNNAKLETQNSKYNTWNTELEIQNLKHKTQNTKLGTMNSNTKLGTQNSKHKTRNTKLKTQNSEHNIQNSWHKVNGSTNGVGLEFKWNGNDDGSWVQVKMEPKDCRHYQKSKNISQISKSNVFAKYLRRAKRAGFFFKNDVRVFSKKNIFQKSQQILQNTKSKMQGGPGAQVSR